LDEFVDRERGGARLGAFPAGDAGLGIAANARGTEKRDHPQKGAVRAQEAAPEVLDKDGSENEKAQHEQAGCADVAEKIEHFDVGDKPIGTLHEVADASGGHGGNGPEEKSQEQVFEAAKRKIEPAREMEILSKELAARAPEVFRDSTDGAKPTAEGFAQQESHGEEGKE